MDRYLSSPIRPELGVYLADLGGGGTDPNRATVEFLRAHASQADEVLCNYEDIPLMFYLENPIRGGIGCFRVTDARDTPRFAIVRRSVGFCHRAIYHRAMGRHRWRAHVLDAPDIPWGNNPDPRFHHSMLAAAPRPLVVYERVR